MNEKMRADLQLTTVHELNMMLFGQPDLACCYKIVDKFSPSFELVTFLESLNFTHTFSFYQVRSQVNLFWRVPLQLRRWSASGQSP